MKIPVFCFPLSPFRYRPSSLRLLPLAMVSLGLAQSEALRNLSQTANNLAGLRPAHRRAAPCASQATLRNAQH